MRTDAYLLGKEESRPVVSLSASGKFVKSSVQAALSMLAQTMVAALAKNSEPRIWQSRDRNGSVAWHLYDPLTNQHARFYSEQEIRIWLEQRYHH